MFRFLSIEVHPFFGVIQLGPRESFFGGYFGSEWSFARFRVPDYRCIACFGSTTNTVAVMCADGSYYKAKFDPVFGGIFFSEYTPSGGLIQI
ncbi:WD repeat domain phosphoinositide-interacting protein 3 [Perkinsus olseni]|uniref:WD repeat domain phosphoinositide-interacting protein 3 n=1 Tax=Perkinsus olseni TaxID=32597 RepID=A0A7J6TB07_PEROL|nr:WD repeat domain phosphoinositide-interacting protein 3 [Perkinsus olseni]KAF4742459.1 WD repeat domain phosphoinositide-interacting protein 3 [Perkinsus olseni]